MSETHLPKDGSITCPGYTSFVNNRQEQHVDAPSPSGGVAILIKNSVLDSYEITVIDKSYDGILGLKCKHKLTGFTAILFACYLPPQNSPWGRNAPEFFAHLISEIYFHSYADFIICGGDINARIGNSEISDINLDSGIPSRKVLDVVKAGHHLDFVDFLKDARFAITNGCVTPELDNFTNVKRGRSVVDYIFVPHDCFSNVLKCQVELANSLAEECGASELIGERCKMPDHSMVSIQMNWGSPPGEISAHESSSTHGNKRYRFQDLNSESLDSETWKRSLQLIIDRLLERHFAQRKLDEIYDLFCKSLFSELDSIIGINNVPRGSKKRFKNRKPYWNDHLRLLWIDMIKCEKEFTNYKGFNRVYKNRLYHRHLNAQCIFDKELRTAARRYNKEKVLEIEEVCVNDHHAFWDKIKGLGPRKQNKIPLTVRTSQGVTSDVGAVLNKWESDFSDLLNRRNDRNIYDNEFYDSCMFNKAHMEQNMQPTNDDYLINSPVSMNEVQLVVSKLKKRKACGLDMIPNEVLKCKSVLTFLHALFKKCFEIGCVPSMWQKSIIKPIPKSSDKDPYLPLSYRGISLISCISKAYSSLLNDRIVKFCEKREIFPDEQNGFRSKRSCEDHIFSLSTLIKNRINQKKSTFCAFVDFEKAFDWVNRNLLLYRLLDNNIVGKMYFAVESILSNTMSCINLDSNVQTNWFDNVCGVKQGDSLSPTLFSMYINDLVKTLKQKGPLINVDGLLLNILLYADDMVLVADSEKDLQLLLDILHEWCAKWRLSLNKDKTEVVHFRPSRVNKSNTIFRYGQIELKTVSSYKYLGIILDEFLNFDLCTKALATAGGRALGGIISKFKILKNVGFHTFTKLYNAGVTPVLEYSSGVWGYVKGEDIDHIQNRAMRYFLGVHRFTPIAGMHGDMGWVSHRLNRYIPLIRLWNRLLLMKDDRLTKKIFMWDYKQKNGWCSEISKIFHKFNLGQKFSDKQFCDLRVITKKVNETMGDQWKTEVDQKPKLRTYKLFKNEFKTSNSVFINNRSKRSLLSRFRLGILALRIETGRWYQGIDANLRLCKICNNGEVEDEQHFLMRCNVYNDFRQSLFDKCTFKNNSFNLLSESEKFIYIVNCQERDLADFIYLAWNRRRNYLYN